MTSPGHVRTAAARKARTRAKHDRWIAELSGAGWSVVQAGHVTVGATAVFDERMRAADKPAADHAVLDVYCTRCDTTIREWQPDRDVTFAPLPQVLHAVSGHTCEEKS